MKSFDKDVATMLVLANDDIRNRVKAKEDKIKAAIRQSGKKVN